MTACLLIYFWNSIHWSQTSRCQQCGREPSREHMSPDDGLGQLLGPVCWLSFCWVEAQPEDLKTSLKRAEVLSHSKLQLQMFKFETVVSNFSSSPQAEYAAVEASEVFVVVFVLPCWVSLWILCRQRYFTHWTRLLLLGALDVGWTNDGMGVFFREIPSWGNGKSISWSWSRTTCSRETGGNARKSSERWDWMDMDCSGFLVEHYASWNVTSPKITGHSWTFRWKRCNTRTHRPGHVAGLELGGFSLIWMHHAIGPHCDPLTNH